MQVVAHAIYASLSDATRSSGGVSGASGGASGGGSGGLHLGGGAVGTKRKFYDVNDSSSISSSRGLAS